MNAVVISVIWIASVSLPNVVASVWMSDAAKLSAALDSIKAKDLNAHVAALADDTFEGREGGSRGGRAAALYIVRQLQKFAIPGGVNGKYYQPFGTHSNVIGLLEGSDPVLKNEYIIVGAHYDHVGYGTRRNSYGPTGYIHNGADDNASGVSAVLEVAEAFKTADIHPKRSILFCFWDGEEKGLFGSKYWLDHPTVPLKQVALAFNADMLGRLRKNRLEIVGWRTSPGMRRLVSTVNDDPALQLFFNWEIKENSDHHPFFAKGVPIVMFHTGLHDDYHRPSDDVEKINFPGMQTVSRLLFQFIDTVADAPSLGKFRAASRQESPHTQRTVERPLPALPGRLGLAWNPKDAEAGRLVVTKITPGSAAEKAGIKPGDVLTELAGEKLDSANKLRSLVLTAKNPVAAKLQRGGEGEPQEVTLELAGTPIRFGISWRTDDAEPGSLIVNRVVPGSAADLAGIKLNDRILGVGEDTNLTTERFLATVADATEPLPLVVESDGQPKRVEVTLPPKTTQPAAQ